MSINVLKKIQVEDYLKDKKNILELHNSPLFDKALDYFQKERRSVEYILNENTGMGNTGESYIVNKDFTMLTRSRFFSSAPPSSIKVHTEAVRLAFSGIKDVKVLTDYRGEEVLSAFSKLDVEGVEWVIVSEIDMNEAMQPVYRIRSYIVLTGFLISLLILIITVFISRRISRPILYLHGVISNLAKGILPDKEIKVASRDEVGRIATAINELTIALKNRSKFANEIGMGVFLSNFKPLSDYDELGTSLLQMRDSLKKLKEQELNFVRERSAALLEGEESERKRMARELHDGIGQMLTAIRLRLNFIEDESIKNELKKILDETIVEIKRISKNLMPTSLVDLGLKSALKGLIDDSSRYSGVRIDFTFEGNENAGIGFETAVSLYRIAQEALNNSLKYANASLIELKIHQDVDMVELQIKDNGVGFDVSLVGEKMYNGIKNMQERVNILNGQFSMHSEPGKGTSIIVSVKNQ